MHFTLCCLGSSGALLFDHNRLLAPQNSTGTSQGSLEKQRSVQIRFPRALKSILLTRNSPCAGPSCICSYLWCASGYWGWRESSCWLLSSRRKWQVCSDLCKKAAQKNILSMVQTRKFLVRTRLNKSNIRVGLQNILSKKKKRGKQKENMFENCQESVWPQHFLGIFAWKWFTIHTGVDRQTIFTSTLLQHNNNSLAISCWLNTNSLLVHQTIEAERVPCLQVVGFLSHK